MKLAALEYLWFLGTIPILALFFLYAYKRRQKKLTLFAQKQTLERIAPKRNTQRTLLRWGLHLSVLFFLTLALIRPQWGKEMQLVQRKGLDLMVLQDVSLSMLAEDISPNRLTRSKHEISAFLNKLRGDRAGLLAFAGESQLLCPLTLDYGAMRLFLNDLNPYTIEPGTDLGGALDRALQIFSSTEKRAAKYQVILLLTDGEEHDAKVLEIAKKARDAGINIYAVGIGSTEGVPIPLESKQGKVYKKDSHGAVVTTKLEEKTLQAITQLTGGKYYHAVGGGFGLERILEDLDERERRDIEGRIFEQYKERFQIPLAIALVLLFLELMFAERRKKVILEGEQG